MTPEAKARVNIDRLLQQAGWHVCNMVPATRRRATANSLESDRRLSLNRGVESEVDANLERAGTAAIHAFKSLFSPKNSSRYSS